MAALLVIVTHLGLIVAMLVLRAVLGVRFGGPLWIVSVLVPVAGPASALGVAWAERTRHAGSRSLNYDETRAAALMRPLVDATDADDVVPLEDAMLVNDAETRRSLMMEVMLEGASGLDSSLDEARSSGDVEVAHYASSATTELADALDASLAQDAAAYQAHPDDIEVVDRYLATIEHYLGSGLATGELRRIQESRYREVLWHKVELAPTETDLANLAASELGEGLFEEADRTIARLEREWPYADATWLLRVRYWYGLRRADKIREMVQRRAHLHSSPAVRSVVEFWEKVNS